jgi:hypothetical protein
MNAPSTAPAAQAALDEELCNQRPGPRPERAANRHFPAPPDAAREEEVRDVGAGDQQEQAGGAEQQTERPLGAAGRRLAQRAHRQLAHPSVLGVAVRKCFRALAGDAGSLLPRPGDRRTGPEAPSHVEHPVIALRHVLGRRVERPPDVDRRTDDCLRQCEARVEHADHRDRHVIDANRAADHARVAAEHADPGTVRKNGHVRDL